MKRKTLALLGTLTALAVVGSTQLYEAEAADHLDPNDRVTAGDAGDIGDLYAWHGDGTLKAVLTFAGPVAPGTDAAYSRDVLYAIHIDGADEDNEPDHTMWFRFGQDSAGAWGVLAEGVPGADADVVGAVDEVLESGSAMVFAGQRDDPFFFDLQGFQETLSMATLRFDADRDFFAGQNINAIVVEFPHAMLGFDGPYNIWATTATGG